MAIDVGIITPTFNRRILLRRYLRRIGLQSYKRWHLLVVHDGPNPSIRALVDGFSKLDNRVSYLETKRAANDSGVSPRLEGVNRIMTAEQAPEYIVFWDDDNSYMVDALERIVAGIEAFGKPDLLLVGVKYRSEIIPPPDVQVRALRVGQVDTASLVFRTALAQEAYSSIQKHQRFAPKEIALFNDFLAYKYVSEAVPCQRIERDLSVLVGQHDGMRWGPSIRSALRIPPLGVARLIRLGR